MTRRNEIWDNVMSGKYPRKDWFDYADADERIRAAEIATRGSGNKVERDMLRATPCPMGRWHHEPRTVLSRLPIWC